MAGRRDDGYEVRSRITTRSDRRTRLLVGAIAVAGGLWLIASLTADKRPPVTADATPGPSLVANPPSPQIATHGPSLPLDIERFPNAPTALIPIQMSGLAWMDPDNAAIVNGPDPRWAHWPLLLADGSVVCVCLEMAGPGAFALHVLRYDAAGEVVGGSMVDAWPNAGDEVVLLGAAIAPDGQSVFVASVRYVEAGSELRVDRIDTEGSLLAGTVVGTIAAEDLAQSSVRVIDLWVAPDGGHLRVRAGEATTVPGSVAEFATWEVGVTDSGFGKPRRLAVAAPDSDLLSLTLAEGWASPSDYVTVSEEQTIGGSTPEVVVRRASLDGSSDSISLGDSIGQPTTWLLDATHSVVFGWVSGAHLLVRVDIPTMAVLSRQVPVPVPDQVLDAEAPVPRGHPGRAFWMDATAPTFRVAQTLLGSPDGSLLYAAGAHSVVPRPPVTSGSDSAGIFVFDAETLALVGHWLPGASYDWIGLTTDGRHLLGVGRPSSLELTLHGNRGPSLVIHETTDGRIVEIVRRIQAQLGNVPTFLIAAPGP